jgi:lysophospholipase L1-like esterase
MDPKKRAWIWSGLALATGVGVVVLLGPRPALAVRPMLLPGERFVVIGDSLAQGLAMPFSQLAQDASVQFAEAGHQGSTILDWAHEPWLDEVLSARPRLLVVSLGTNDMLLGAPLAEEPALRALVGRIQASGARQLWLMPPSMPFPDAGVRDMLERAGMDLFPSDALDIPRGPDQIHPTAMGYAGWAGAVWHYVMAPALSG